MTCAVIFAPATASTTVRPPWTTSPAAKTPGTVVRPSASTFSKPFSVPSSPSVVLMSFDFGP